MADNAFVRIDDWARAQELADFLSPDQLHRALDRYAAQCCRCLTRSGDLPLEPDAGGIRHRWRSRSTTSLGPLYEQLIREFVLGVKAEQIATFLGRQITPLLAGRSAHGSPPASRGPA